MKYNLVLQSYGRDSEYRRALLCLYSFFRFADKDLDRVILFTDKPEFFSSCLQDSPVQFIRLTSEKIKVMRGEIDFLHRMKIAMIEEAFHQTSGNLLYVDSDAIFTANPGQIMKSVSPTVSAMHMEEYKLTILKSMQLPAGAPFHAFYDLISTSEFKLASGKIIQLPLKAASWNAGAMAFHHSHKDLLNDVYTLTDQFYPPTLNHASEQYAFSFVLQMQTQILPMSDVVFHYWYRVKKKIVDDLLAHKMNEKFFLGKKGQREKWAYDLYFNLPRVLKNHILTLRDNSIQAFHENEYRDGFKYALRSILKGPFDSKFLLDFAYHIRRFLKSPFLKLK